MGFGVGGLWACPRPTGPRALHPDSVTNALQDPEGRSGFPQIGPVAMVERRARHVETRHTYIRTRPDQREC